VFLLYIVKPVGSAGLGSALEAAEVGDDSDQDLLGGIFGILRVAEEPQGEPVHRMLEPANEVAERGPVTVGGPPCEVVEVESRVRVAGSSAGHHLTLADELVVGEERVHGAHEIELVGAGHQPLDAVGGAPTQQV
jgi:hypothetical protein